MEEYANILNKEQFLEKYHLKDCFVQSGLQWETLQQIYQDYLQSFIDIKKICKSFETHCQKKLSSNNISYHSLRCRAKNPEHLIEKIIRKRGKEQSQKYKDINAKNYKTVIRDLIGIRILVIKKEDWESIFNEIIHMFPQNKNNTRCYMAEKPIAYIRYGDRDIYNDKIKKEYSNKGYRSQHYIVWFKGYYCEIQVRTLAEEVHGEFDHLVKYPYRDDNNFLLRYTNTFAEFTNAIDEMISTCLQMQENGWENNNEYFGHDIYVDWSKTSQSIIFEKESEENEQSGNLDAKLPINIQQYATNKLLRKGNGKNEQTAPKK